VFVQTEVKWLLIDTSASIQQMLDTISPPRPSDRSRIFIHLHNIYWGGQDRLCFLAIHYTVSSQNFLMDVYSLGATAFSTPASDGTTTFKTILESPTIPKCIFGVQNELASLYHGFGVRLRCVHDVQLFEVATRLRQSPTSWRFRSEFDATVVRYSNMSVDEMNDWITTKSSGVRLAADGSEKGATYDVFMQQLRNQSVSPYSVNYVACLPFLYEKFAHKLSPQEIVELTYMTERAIANALSPTPLA
jgi:exonuclease 3'-5' domain-containing protein 1